MSKDIDTLKYFLKNKTLNGSPERLARMIRLELLVMVLLLVLTILYVQI